MTPIYQIQSEILTYLDEWKEFIWGLDLVNTFGRDKKSITIYMMGIHLIHMVMISIKYLRG
jgi:hypothetical protein